MSQNQQEEKNNSRKRSNKKKAGIEKVVNTFAENEIVNFTGKRIMTSDTKFYNVITGR